MANTEQPQLFGVCFACPDETDKCNPLMCETYYRWAVATMPEVTPQKAKRKRERKRKRL